MWDSLQSLLSKLRSGHLAALAAVLFLIDVVFPDPLPFLDEVVLALLTLLLARRKPSETRPGTRESKTRE